MIEFRELYKSFGKLTVLDGLNLTIQERGIVSVLGPNGSGKTTLIKCFLGMVVPNSGDILLQGKSTINEYKFRNDINYLPQIANFPPNLKVIELLQMVKDLREKEAHEHDLIKLFALEEHLHKKLGNLSGGTKQKVNIVLTFMFHSDIIILDEPTTGLDPVSLQHLKQLIHTEKEKGRTILITSHIMSFVEEITDDIVFLLEGKIYFQGSVAELKSKINADSLEQAIAHLMSDNDA